MNINIIAAISKNRVIGNKGTIPWIINFKDGQKFVKGSKYPRSYYKCTSVSNMNIQKHVEEVDGGQILVTFHTHSLDFAKELEKKVPGSVLIMPTD